MQGKVKWFNKPKGFGFIAGDDGKDYFVSYSDIINDFEKKYLMENQIVEFKVVQAPKGLKAIKVILIQKGDL